LDTDAKEANTKGLAPLCNSLVNLRDGVHGSESLRNNIRAPEMSEISRYVREYNIPVERYPFCKFYEYCLVRMNLVLSADAEN